MMQASEPPPPRRERDGAGQRCYRQGEEHGKLLVWQWEPGSAAVPTTLILPQQDQGEQDFGLGDVQNTRNIGLEAIGRREMKS
jgi:hypothetical protein